MLAKGSLVFNMGSQLATKYDHSLLTQAPLGHSNEEEWQRYFSESTVYCGLQ